MLHVSMKLEPILWVLTGKIVKNLKYFSNFGQIKFNKLPPAPGRVTPSKARVIFNLKIEPSLIRNERRLL